MYIFLNLFVFRIFINLVFLTMIKYIFHLVNNTKYSHYTSLIVLILYKLGFELVRSDTTPFTDDTHSTHSSTQFAKVSFTLYIRLFQLISNKLCVSPIKNMIKQE